MEGDNVHHKALIKAAIEIIGKVEEKGTENLTEISIENSIENPVEKTIEISKWMKITLEILSEGLNLSKIALIATIEVGEIFTRPWSLERTSLST
jgi:hypothetical protein